jgi:hypothetical protein
VAIKVIGYRAGHGLSQAQLARMLGMRQPHVARLEAGRVESPPRRGRAGAVRAVPGPVRRTRPWRPARGPRGRMHWPVRPRSCWARRAPRTRSRGSGSPRAAGAGTSY